MNYPTKIRLYYDKTLGTYRFLCKQKRTLVTREDGKSREQQIARAIQPKVTIKKRHNYSNTVLLPRTEFRAQLNGKERVEKDECLTRTCSFSELYEWQRKNLPGPDFVLHDGPPYANGVPHMGHAINKILKDITLRSKVIHGKRVHYMPGWDCHGLPIELKAIQNNDISDPLEIRRKAREYAGKVIAEQKQAFQSWGVMADWKESGYYCTNESGYMKDQLYRFMNLYEKGIVFRSFMPVYWSPSSRTALAESELEYNEKHQSRAVIIRLRVNDLPETLNSFKNRDVYALIWTTTPWTLVANQAVAFLADGTYCLAEDDTGKLNIVAEKLLQDVGSKVGRLKTVACFEGKELQGSTYFHPLKEEKLPFLAANHVTMDMGTGLVHIAPAHGPDDFLVALKNNMHVLSLVDAEGRYTETAGSQFNGLQVLTEGVDQVLKLMAQNVLHVETFTHSYPYDWRTKEPVIIRASNQWFIDINRVREKVIDALGDIQVYPKRNSASMMNGLLIAIKNRPYWCISRQRSWGTPIPVFYSKATGKPLINKELVERLCNSIEQYGPDCWWERSVEELVGLDAIKGLNVGVDDIEKGKDIMDIWFDSGISWSIVLPDGKADLYLEGCDQFNGWFQSSLITSVALQGRPPYSALFVHGFAVDENGLKMSKSIGNVINPKELLVGGSNLEKNPAYGIDVLRWWVANHGLQHVQSPVSKHLFDECKQQVNKLRLILRFLLGVLHPYGQHVNYDAYECHRIVDKYMLYLLYHYNGQMQQYYDDYEYHNAGKTMIHFITNTVSALYCSLIKDRLYCEEATSPLRTSALHVVKATFNVLLKTITPILPHLAEEAWMCCPKDHASTSLYHTSYEISESWNKPETAKYLEAALRLRKDILRTSYRNTWKVDGIIHATKEDFFFLSLLYEEHQSSVSQLCEILQLSSVKLVENQTLAKTQIELKENEKTLCARCRRYPETREDGLCIRCIKVLENNTLNDNK